MESTTALVAAKWWGDLIRRKVSPNENNRACLETDHYAMMAIMGGTLQDALYRNQGIDEGKIVAFEGALAKWLEAQPWYFSGLSVDYDPCLPLSEAAKAAGFEISMGFFPFKTSMRVEGGTVLVREGYGAEWTEVAPAQADEGE